MREIIIETSRHDDSVFEVGVKMTPTRTVFLPGMALSSLMDLRDALNNTIENELFRLETGIKNSGYNKTDNK